MKKSILILLLLNSFLHSLEISSKKVENAKTLFLTLKKQNISKPKLTFDKKNIDFYAHPTKKNIFYALVPISYYKDKKKYRIIISYIKDGKKIFEGVSIDVVDGKYKSEKINVQKGKVSLSKKNKERTKKEYKKAMKVYSTQTKKLYIKEDFIYPLDSKITSHFGTKRVYNGQLKSYHSGTDFKAKIGTAIKAVNSGKIVIAENRFYAGNSIVIDHGQGIFSCYFHLSKMNFKVGDFVKRGEIIGLSGDTGRVTGPHLHFSFRIHNVQVDPLQLIELLNINLNN